MALGRDAAAALMLLSILLGQTSCRTMRPTRDDLLAGYTPERFTTDAAGVEHTSEWWKAFGSDQLNRLVADALAGNLTLERAAARLEQAEAAARKSGADTIPSLNVQATSAWGDPNAQGSATETSHSFGLHASYEIDLWGRVRSRRKAAGAELEASRFDIQTAAMTISGELAETYFNWLAQSRTLAICESQLRSSRDRLNAVEARYRTGQSPSLSVLQQRQQVAAAEAKLPPVRSALKSLEHSMAILLGKPAGTNLGLAPEPLPRLPDRPAAGLPADVVRNRPDVQAARLTLEAADWNVGAARAARLPAITLTGSHATSGEDLDLLFDDWASNLAAGLLGPLLDGGARRAEADRALAVSRERLAAYRLAVLEAVRETETALSSEQHQAEYVDAIEKQLAAARKTETDSIRRYERGILPYLDTLTAITSRESLDIALVQARAKLLSDRVQLYRALGGDWASILEEQLQ